MKGCLLAFIALAIWPGSSQAHEMRPAYLELREVKPAEYHVLWKTPMRGDARLKLDPEFSGETRPLTTVTAQRSLGAAVQRWDLHAPALRGQTLTIRGLESTVTDALVRMEFLDGTVWTHRFTAKESSAVIPARQDKWTVAGLYGKLGIEHILFGVDHLLFVFGLLLLVSQPGMLLKTITSFTLAHSITLGLVTLGQVRLPSAAVEALIALSILFLGPEIVRLWRGQSSLMIRHPWGVAFGFGLLHGIGFSSAMTDTGLPRPDLPLALLSFNIGVEIGQLAFVGLILVVVRLLRPLTRRWPLWVLRVPGYAVGSLGAFWTIQRTVMIFR